MQNARKRMQHELRMLEREPGISAWPQGDNLLELEACVLGAEGTPYEGGTFNLEIHIPERYPYEPPRVRFVTAIYHPNIDTGGRICLDTLVMPPKGVWTPSLNVATVLTSIQSLMSGPNPDDPLMADINDIYVHNHPKFVETATQWTHKYARHRDLGSSATLTVSSSTKMKSIHETSSESVGPSLKKRKTDEEKPKETEREAEEQTSESEGSEESSEEDVEEESEESENEEMSESESS